MSLAVVCFQWKPLNNFVADYSAKHVNRLFEMVKRNTTIKHKFIVFTDTPDAGYAEGIEVQPLWESPAPAYGTEKRPNCFYRLRLFAADAKDLLGTDRCVWLDLDALIVGNIDHILKDTSDLKVWRVDGEISPTNGSLVSFRVGARPWLWDKFDPSVLHPEDGYIRSTGFIGSDQAWLAQHIQEGDEFFGQRDGVYSYRCHLLKRVLPPDACIVFFHGREFGKPDDLWGIPWIRRTLEAIEAPFEPAVASRASTRVIPREKLRVVVWKWKPRPGTPVQYNAETVNTMLAMIDRNYKAPYEMVCITDNATGIDGAVRIVPLWDDLAKMQHPVEDMPQSPICYRRLKAFAPGMADVISPWFVSVDLDAVVTGDLTVLWNRKEDFVGWDRGLPWSPYCGSMWMLRAGTRPQVWTKFDPHRTPREAAAAGFVGTDQAAMAYLLGPGEKVWTDVDGVFSFAKLGYTEDRRSRRAAADAGKISERDLRRQERQAIRKTRDIEKRLSRESIPLHCKIVFFPGPPTHKPWVPAIQNSFRFVSKLYRQ